jgi:hypothetical protein
MFVGPVWYLIRVALLAARILGRFLHFFYVCTPALGQQLGIGTTVGKLKCIDGRLAPVLNERPRH